MSVSAPIACSGLLLTSCCVVAALCMREADTGCGMAR